MAAFPVFLSDSRYNLLRSTTMSVVIRDNARNISVANNVIEYDDLRFGLYHVVLKVRESFWSWSSSYYTLDYVFDYEQFRLFINGVEVPQFGIFVWADIKENEFGLHLYVSLFTPSEERHSITLPSAPQGYWLPTTG